ncbi:hypothetical protein BRE01_62900 [Brevibacillus reuszeri]|uniref:Uncharacterized protein n=1 Tax=Brevibacillus reuszeri TaxID=54915 RepID=A0A0K9YW59_9BACL|nr:hypothetical protein [Brevibacillus reuszeri]KNB72969.1 hypothetical protein ADS79_14205 [Brevibacillus reuszeri]GED72588.1 hypothetical protein BRE01_62900 [Brevibacillus reuszeri]
MMKPPNNLSLIYDEESDGFYLENGKGEILDPEEHNEVIKKLSNFLSHYGSHNIAELVIKRQEELAQMHLEYTTSRFIVEERNFKRSKNRSKPWTFVCDFCNNKYTDEEMDKWFTISAVAVSEGVYCSKECADTDLINYRKRWEESKQDEDLN